jgi:membrane associated rhomboid family serine protease
MIPLRDENPSSRIPYVNYLLIAVNIFVFILEWNSGASGEAFIQQYALIPASFSDGIQLPDVQDVFTSMFMHAGLAHIGGNMLYLWIFGDNIEDAMGHGRFLLFYLLGGVLASAAHIISNPGSQLPTVGASGAIGAVLGAYLVLYPRRRVLTLIFLGFFINMVRIPAVLLLGFWFVLQLFSGVMSLGGPEMGGVAFWAHIGGFVGGMLLVRLFARPKPTPVYQAYERRE